MAISDSVTDVNLPVFSKKATDSINDFFKEFNENFNFLYSIIMVIGAFIVYWSQEILRICDYLIYLVIKILNLNLTKNIYGTRLYAGRSANGNISYPLILPEKTIIEFIILAGEYNKSKLWNGTGYLCIIETDN